MRTHAHLAMLEVFRVKSERLKRWPKCALFKEAGGGRGSAIGAEVCDMGVTPPGRSLLCTAPAESVDIEQSMSLSFSDGCTVATSEEKEGMMPGCCMMVYGVATQVIELNRLYHRSKSAPILAVCLQQRKERCFPLRLERGSVNSCGHKARANDQRIRLLYVNIG